ncbi:hypothetical protein Pla108_22090 [Botrimarina colliarenosi]|uniref:PEP-CTERM protein-sorting domain-containing protein n=1 Tax=Botrimarina colliarenosi TaxID=2528001 RepID=A0A5C6ADL5_9BACT|nr:hypothetical protein [Botrimarina colliarenosi]TWT98054.1 hypothetical protein Pla108_22090 [Botrimarina colliarenosi]
MQIKESQLAFWCVFNVLATVVAFPTIYADQELLPPPTLPAGVINSPPTLIGANESIGSNTTLNVFDGGYVGSSFVAGHFSGLSTDVEVNVSGGTMEGFTVYGGVVNVSGGSVGGLTCWNGCSASVSGGTVSGLGSNFSTINIGDGASIGRATFGQGSVANISGGIIGEIPSSAYSTLNISGGVFSGAIDTEIVDYNISGGVFEGIVYAFLGSVDISGGVFGERFIATGNTMNIRGGEFTEGLSVHGSSGVSDSNVNIFGTEFFLDGVPLDLTSWLPTTIAERDVLLSGILADGSPFEFNLVSTFTPPVGGSVIDEYFSPDAVLTLTLVPEPCASMLVSLLAIGGFLTAPRRTTSPS